MLECVLRMALQREAQRLSARTGGATAIDHPTPRQDSPCSQQRPTTFVRGLRCSQRPNLSARTAPQPSCEDTRTWRWNEPRHQRRHSSRRRRGFQFHGVTQRQGSGRAQASPPLSGPAAADDNLPFSMLTICLFCWRISLLYSHVRRRSCNWGRDFSQGV